MFKLIQLNRESTKGNEYVMQTKILQSNDQYIDKKITGNRYAQAHQYKWTIVKSIKLRY